MIPLDPIKTPILYANLTGPAEVLGADAGRTIVLTWDGVKWSSDTKEEQP